MIHHNPAMKRGAIERPFLMEIPMDLKTQAEALGIKVDGRWSDERIQQEIDKVSPVMTPQTGPEVVADKPAKAEKLIPVRINRDFWGENEVRYREGTIVEVTVEAALDGIETGALSRVK